MFSACLGPPSPAPEVHGTRLCESDDSGHEIFIFLIRHGESTWNQAKADSTTSRMEEMLHVDHPLSAEGVQQAVALNACWQEHELNLRSGFLHEDNDPTLAQMHRVFTD